MQTGGLRAPCGSNRGLSVKAWQVVAFLAGLSIVKGASMPLIGWAFEAWGLVDIYSPFASMWLWFGAWLAAFAALLRWARP